MARRGQCGVSCRVPGRRQPGSCRRRQPRKRSLVEVSVRCHEGAVGIGHPDVVCSGMHRASEHCGPD
eukprot:2529734-Pleurochrysis_carterae.AAC.5